MLKGDGGPQWGGLPPFVFWGRSLKRCSCPARAAGRLLSPFHTTGGRLARGKRVCLRKVSTSRTARFGKGEGSLRGEGNPFTRQLKGFPSPINEPTTMNRCYCPARAAGRLPGEGQGVRGVLPLYTPRTPRNPGTRKVSFPANSPPSAARRVGRRREPSRPFGAGDVRACSGAPSALRASGIAFAPAPRCIVGKMRGRPRLGRSRGQISGRGREQRRGEESNGQGTRPDSFFALPHVVRAFHL